MMELYASDAGGAQAAGRYGASDAGGFWGQWEWPPPAKARHLAGIQAIADEVARPFDEIALAYHREVVDLAAHAAVFEYLPVLTAKRIRALYKRRAEALARASASPPG